MYRKLYSAALCYRCVLTFRGIQKSVFVIVIAAIRKLITGLQWMFWLKTIVVVGRSSSRRPGTKGDVTFCFPTCYLLTFSLVVFSLLYFSLSPSQLTLFVCWTLQRYPHLSPCHHHLAWRLCSVLMLVCLSSSTSSVITVVVTKALYIHSTVVSAQGVFYLLVTVARYRCVFQLLCPCGERNLLKSKTYFMYHNLYYSEILCSAHNVFVFCADLRTNSDYFSIQ
jgi:hypothetical protein